MTTTITIEIPDDSLFLLGPSILDLVKSYLDMDEIVHRSIGVAILSAALEGSTDPIQTLLNILQHPEEECDRDLLTYGYDPNRLL